jgi:hypothetical protein
VKAAAPATPPSPARAIEVKPTRLAAVAARATEILMVWNFIGYLLSKTQEGRSIKLFWFDFLDTNFFIF